MVGASVLAVGGLAAWSVQQPTIGFTATHCGVAGTGKRRLLVAYGSQYGTTGEVADAIGKVYCEAGHAVDVVRIQDDPDPSAYDAVVIGAPVHSDAWLKDAVTYAGDHHTALAGMPVAYFLTCMTLGMSQQPEARQRIAGVFTPVRDALPDVQPIDTGLFAGMLDFSRMSFATQLLYRAFAENSTEGDYRDWAAIRNWATSIQPQLTAG